MASISDVADNYSDAALMKAATSGNLYAIIVIIAKAAINVLCGMLYDIKGSCMSARINTASQTTIVQGKFIQEVGIWAKSRIGLGATPPGHVLAEFFTEHMKECGFSNVQVYEARRKIYNFFGSTTQAGYQNERRAQFIKAGLGDALYTDGQISPPQPGGDPTGGTGGTAGNGGNVPAKTYKTGGFYGTWGQLRIPNIGEIPCDKDSATMRCSRGTYVGYRLYGLTATQVIKLNAPLSALLDVMDPNEHIGFYNQYAWKELRKLGVSDTAIADTYGPNPGVGARPNDDDGGDTGGGNTTGTAAGIPTWQWVAGGLAVLSIGGSIAYAATRK